MARILDNNPQLMIKLAATTMSLSLATAKLIAYNRSVCLEVARDVEYLKSMERYYEASADYEKHFADKFTAVSHEVDQLVLGKNKK